MLQCTLLSILKKNPGVLYFYVWVTLCTFMGHYVVSRHFFFNFQFLGYLGRRELPKHYITVSTEISLEA